MPRRRAERRGLRLWHVWIVLPLAFVTAIAIAAGVFFTGWDLLGARGASFSGATVSFYGANFSSGTVSFDAAAFSSGEVAYTGATGTPPIVLIPGDGSPLPTGLPLPEAWHPTGQ
ncbi:hypothetical protein [Streptomyces coeruleorubidus]|uniref:hypothetical protein n=1 Tax=Streptomyces coeruleorubidus TaxID=116188 RepID=UPI0033B1FDA6